MGEWSLTPDFIEAERKRFRKNYSQKLRVGFDDADQFASWCVEKLKDQEGRCAYCETSILLIRRIIDEVSLSNDKTMFHRFRGVRGGRVHGRTLEVEQRGPDAGYTPENCSLVCYFCNNDKSYVYSEADYRKFFAAGRKQHFESVARRLGIIR